MPFVGDVEPPMDHSPVQVGTTQSHRRSAPDVITSATTQSSSAPSATSSSSLSVEPAHVPRRVEPEDAQKQQEQHDRTMSVFESNATNETWSPLASRKTIWQQFVANLYLSVEYTRTDIYRRPRNCLMGFVAVVAIVFFTGLVLASINKTSYLLLRFAELTVGEMDAVVYATNGVVFVNFSTVAANLAANATNVISGASPRWVAKGTMRSWVDVLQRRIDANRQGLAVNLSDIPFLTTNIVIADTEKEKEIGIGRGWYYRPIGYGEAQLTATAMDFLKMPRGVGTRGTVLIDLAAVLGQQSINLGDVINIPINVSLDQLVTLPQPFNGTNINITTTIPIATSTITEPQIDFNVVDAVTDPNGKYSTALGNVLLMDYKYMTQLWIDQSCFAGPQILSANGGATTAIPSTLQIPAVANALYSINPLEYAIVIIAMFTGRYDAYYKDDKGLAKEAVKYSNSIMSALNYDFPGRVEYPLVNLMVGFNSFNALLLSLFAAAVVVILVQSSVLVFSLLGTNGEERQFELAMIRAQGMSKLQLLYLMTIEVLAFTIPGVLCGTALVIAANAILEKVLSEFTLTPYEPLRLPIGAIIFSVIVGFALPLVSNWSPVSEALQASLRDALDINRQIWSETKVTMIKLAELGLEMWQTLLGAFLVVSGFMVYYLLPLSFIFENMTMFFIIMNIILLVMLFGLCLLAYTIQGVLMRGWLWLLLWGKEKRLHMLIVKTMDSHRSKNTRLYMMFVICISCVVFGGIAFGMVAQTLVALTELAAGADLVVSSSAFHTALNHTDLNAFLRLPDSAAYVAAWGYASYSLNAYPQIVGKTALTNVLGSKRTIPLYAVSESFLDASYPRYVQVSEASSQVSYQQSTTGAVDIVRSLYTNPLAKSVANAEIIYSGFPAGVVAPDAILKVKTVLPIIVASGVKRALGLDTQTLAQLAYGYVLKDSTQIFTNFVVQPRALVSRFPGFGGISSLSFGLGSGAILTSEDAFEVLLQPNATDYAAVNDPSTHLVDSAILRVRYQKLFVRMRSDVSDSQRTYFLNLLQSHLDPFFSNSIDVPSVVKTIRKVATLMMAFYYFSAVISVLLSSFMTWLMFVSNVTHQSWTFGVLRSLGFTKAHTLRAVVYEALSLVLASFSIGLPIGVFVGFTTGLQMTTFLNLPFDFLFPYEIVLVLLAISVLAATIGSWLPMRTLNKSHIAAILKKYV